MRRGAADGVEGAGGGDHAEHVAPKKEILGLISGGSKGGMKVGALKDI